MRTIIAGTDLGPEAGGCNEAFQTAPEPGSSGTCARPPLAERWDVRDGGITLKAVEVIPLGSKQRGFSLLEVLVAFSILALVLGVLLNIFSTSLRGSGVAQHYTQAAILGDSLIGALGSEIPLTSGSHQGQHGELFSWRVVISPSSLDSGGVLPEGVEPLEVRVQVSWTEFGSERTLDFSTLRLTNPNQGS